MTPLSEQEINLFAVQFAQKRQNQVASRAARHNGLLAASFNNQVKANLNGAYSTEVKVGQVTDQKRSGRCWEFATLNVLRHFFCQQYQLKDFVFSQSYNFFWDKLERANAFYNKMIALADRPLDDREVQAWLSFAGGDWGLWPMGINLVQKYGLVPAYAMPESYNANHTAALIDSLARKEKKDALVLRSLAQSKEQEKLAQAKKQMLGQIYQLLAVALGQPPREFDLEYRDVKHQYHLRRNLTPRQFVHQYLAAFPFADYVLLINAPHLQYKRLYHQDIYDNVAGGKPVVALNLPIASLAQAACAQLKAGHAVMFGSDVLKETDRKAGLMDPQVYQTDALLGVDTQMSKGQRLATGESSASHDMTLVGVDEDQGRIRKWKVENSWGDQVGDKGFFSMSQNWFDQYVYDVVVNKKYLPAEEQKLLTQSPIDLKPWQHTGL